MRVKLVFLPKCPVDPNLRTQFSNEIGFPPLGIATLTSFLKKHGIKVSQDDLDVKVVYTNWKFAGTEKSINLTYFLDEKKRKKVIKDNEETLEKEAEKILRLTKWRNFDIIGFSVQSPDNPSAVTIAITLAKLLKEKYDVPVIAGGCMNDYAIKTLLEGGFVDCVLLSSHFGSLGEVNLLKFCEMYEKGVEFHKIPGVIYLDKEKVIYTRRFEDYEVKERRIFTLPDFDGLPMELYQYKVFSKTNGNVYKSKILILPYFFIYGCPNTCAFCNYSRYPLLGVKNPEDVARDLKILSKKYHTKYFYFLNPEINVTKEYAYQVAKQIIKEGLEIKWTDCATFKNMDVKLLEILKEAGASRLVWGLESASQRMLNYIQKGIKLEDAKKILKKSYQIGIFNHILLICGFPYEREHDINLTISFLKENKEYITGGTTLNKFWIDGLFEDNPEKYGLHLKEHTKNYRDWSTRPFDELKGLSWEQKVKIVPKLFEILRKTIEQLGLRGEIPIHIIFHFKDLEDSDIKIVPKIGINFQKYKNLYSVTFNEKVFD